MLDRLIRFPDQMEEALQIGQGAGIPPPAEDIEGVVLGGMGGSAISGDLLKMFTSNALKKPFEVIRHYTLPSHVNSHTLVILSSYSGNTEETLSLYEQAIHRQAPRVCISSGGQLLERAQRMGDPFIRIPKGYPPRTALGYLLIPLLVLFSQWGWTSDVNPLLLRAAHRLREQVARYHPDVPDSENPAKQWAERLLGKIPILYTSTDLAPVGLRWKSQFAENGKMLAFHHTLPEMNHNEIVGWEGLGNKGTPSQVWEVIFLQDPQDHPRVQRRMEITRKILLSLGQPSKTVWGIGDSFLERIFDLIFLGDFISYYLAIFREIDPTTIQNIDYLKEQLAKEPYHGAGK